LIVLERLSRAPVIRVEDTVAPVDRDVELRIAEIWKLGQAVPGSAKHDGTLVSLVLRSKDEWQCRRVPYAWFFAQRREPSLFEKLKVQPLAVTGLIACGDGYLVGRRGGKVEQDAGFWELLPAGGLDEAAIRPDDTVDPVKGLSIEWTEETGCSAGFIGIDPKIVAWVEDQETHVVDLVIGAGCSQPFEVVEECFRNAGTDEYSEIACLTAPQIMSGTQGRFAGVSKLIVSQLLGA